MRTIWKMSSAQPAANYPAEPSTSAQGGLHPVQAAGAEADFMVDDEDDGFDWDSAQPPEPTPGPTSIAAAVTGGDPDSSPALPQEPAEADTIAPQEPAPTTEAAPICAAARAAAEQPERDEPPAQAEPTTAAEQPEPAERLVLLERTRASGKPPYWRWPAAMALLVAAVVALLFFVREQMDAPRTAAVPEFAAEEPLEPTAGFPTPVFEPEPVAPLPQVQAPQVQAAPPPAPTAATPAPRSAPPKQKAVQAAPQTKRQRPPRRARAQQPAAAPADAISCILPSGQEVQASYPSCRARGGVIYR